MQRDKSLIIIGIIAALIIGIVVGSAMAYSQLSRYPLPSEMELPDQTILSNQKDLKEVKAFLSKYPNATIQVDRSGTLSVDYMVDNLSFYSNATATFDNSTSKLMIIDSNGAAIGEYHQLTLIVSVDNEGKPQEISVRCSGRPTIYNFLSSSFIDILSYIETGTCLNLN